jgi:YD repeat-containing protein
MVVVFRRGRIVRRDDHAYSYDVADRVATETINGTATHTYTYDLKDELTSDGVNNYSRDAN